jgi:spore maturation protein CgeB
MRILLVGPGASWSTADVEHGLRGGLIAAGCDVVVYRLDARIDRSRRWLYSAWRRTQKRNQDLEQPTAADVLYHAGIGALEQALRHQVDVVVIVSGMFLHPDVVILMKRAGLRVVALFTESPYDLKKELAIARIVDGCWTNERTSVPAFRHVCARAGYLPAAWTRGRHGPDPLATDAAVAAHDVVFVGSAFRERIDWLEAIDWTGIDLGLYGNWTALGSRHPLRGCVHGPVPLPNTTAAALYRRAKVSLNLYRTAPGAESLNPRAYELAACGAVTVSQPRAETAERFGALVATAATPGAMAGLIRAYLADDDERARIRRALPDTVAQHSWNERVQDVIGDLRAMRAAA